MYSKEKKKNKCQLLIANKIPVNNDPFSVCGLTQPVHSPLHKINYRLKEKEKKRVKAELNTYKSLQAYEIVVI